MKKISVLLLATGMAFMTTQTHAQLQKGNLMVGGDIANFNAGYLGGNNIDNGAHVSFQIDPRIGYFIKDNIAIGGLVNLGLSYKKNGGTTVTYGIGAFGRYYVSDSKLELLKHTRFFAEANLGVAGTNYKVSGQDAIHNNGVNFGIGPGITYFITSNVGLEALAKYNITAGDGTDNYLSIGFGFQIYLPSKKARAMYNETSGEVEHKMKKGKEKKEESDDDK